MNWTSLAFSGAVTSDKLSIVSRSDAVSAAVSFADVVIVLISVVCCTGQKACLLSVISTLSFQIHFKEREVSSNKEERCGLTECGTARLRTLRIHVFRLYLYLLVLLNSYLSCTYDLMLSKFAAGFTF